MTAFERYDNAAGAKRWAYRKRIMLPNGQTTRIKGTPAINTKKAAEDAERAHVERLMNPPKVSAERMRMAAVFEKFMEAHPTLAKNKASEVAQKKSAIDCHLKPLIGSKYLDELDEPALDALALALHKRPKARRGKGTLGPKTVKNILQTLRKCLRWCKRQKWIAEAPIITMPEVPDVTFRHLEHDELDALLVVTAKEPWWHAAALLAADAGLRQGELRALKWTDIGSNGKLVVQRSRWRNQDGPPKSGKDRTVPLTARVLAALDAIKATKLRGPYVFSRAKDGGPFGAEYMNETMARLTRNAGVTNCQWHSLRHTFCTRLAMKGAPAKTIQDLAGHESIMTTMRYMHMARGAADAAIALLESEPRALGPQRARDSSVSENDSEGGVVIQL